MLPFELSFVLSLIAAFLLSLILTPIVRFLSFRVGAVDKPNARRINKTPMPSAGGLAVFCSFFSSQWGFFLISLGILIWISPIWIIYCLCW